MSYRVVVTHEAEKILDRLDRSAEHRIRARLVQLAEILSILASRPRSRDVPECASLASVGGAS